MRSCWMVEGECPICEKHAIATDGNTVWCVMEGCNFGRDGSVKFHTFTITMKDAEHKI